MIVSKITFLLFFIFCLPLLVYWKMVQEKEKIHCFMELYESANSLNDLRNFITLNKNLDYNALIMRYFPDWNPCIKDIEKFQWIFSKVISPNIRVSRSPLQSAAQHCLYSFQRQNISNGKTVGLVEDLYGFSSRNLSSMQKKRKRSPITLLHFNILLELLADPNFIDVLNCKTSLGEDYTYKESLLYSVIGYLGTKESDEDSDGIELVKRLLLFGANPNIGSSIEIGNELVLARTPLMLACQLGQEETVRLLLQRNADPFLMDNYGWTCIDYLKNNIYKFSESSPGNKILALLEEYTRNRIPFNRLYDKKKSTAYFMGALAPCPDENLKFGYIDKHRQWAILPVYDAVSCFENGCAVVKYKGKWGIIDRKGTFLIPPTYSFPPGCFNDGLALIITDSNKIGFKNKNNSWVIAPEYDNAIYFSEGRAAVEKNRKWSIVDTKGNLITSSLDVDSIDIFRDGKARIHKNKSQGFINKSGSIEWE